MIKSRIAVLLEFCFHLSIDILTFILMVALLLHELASEIAVGNGIIFRDGLLALWRVFIDLLAPCFCIEFTRVVVV